MIVFGLDRLPRGQLGQKDKSSSVRDHYRLGKFNHSQTKPRPLLIRLTRTSEETHYLWVAHFMQNFMRESSITQINWRNHLVMKPLRLLDTSHRLSGLSLLQDFMTLVMNLNSYPDPLLGLWNARSIVNKTSVWLSDNTEGWPHVQLFSGRLRGLLLLVEGDCEYHQPHSINASWKS